VSYRPPIHPPKGKWAKAIHAKRRADDLSQTALFELIGKELGFAAKSRTAFRAIDLGDRPPTDDEAKVLAAWLGGWPSEDMGPSGDAAQPSPDVLALVTELNAQTKAMTALVAELQKARTKRDADIEMRLRAMEAELQSLRARPVGGGSRGRSAPHARAG